MNSIALFGLLILILGRLIMLIVAIEYWLRQKTRSHGLYLLGIGSWIVTGILPILGDNIVDVFITDLLVALNIGFSALSLVLFMSGFLCYYNLINLKFIWIYSLFSVITPIIINFSFLNNRLILTLSVIQYFVILFLIVIGIFYRKRIEVQAKNSLKYYYAIIINLIAVFVVIAYSAWQGESYGLYYSTNESLILINYLLGILLTFFLLVFMIQLENDHNNYLMFKLKDNYSHNIGNNLQKLFCVIELIELSKKTESLELAKKICTESADLINEIRDLE